MITPRILQKGKGRDIPGQEVVATPLTVEKEKKRTPTTSGPGGRERKRFVKLGEVERRRARDEKFGVGHGEAYESTVSYSTIILTSCYIGVEDWNDSTDSVQIPTTSIAANQDTNSGSADEAGDGLPQAFIGQEVEDLAYGAGSMEANIGVQIPRDNGGVWWGAEEEEEEVRVNSANNPTPWSSTSGATEKPSFTADADGV